MVPTGAAGKRLIGEISRLLNLWTNNTPLKNIALKAIHVMHAPLLQKPSKTQKTKDHLKGLKRRLILWEEGIEHNRISSNLLKKVKPCKTDCHQQTIK